MGLGRNPNQGNKGSGYSADHRQLLALGEVISGITGSNTILSGILSSVQSDEFEIRLVRDTGNGDIIVQQVTIYNETTEELEVSYVDVTGAEYIPGDVNDLEYLDPSAVLNLMLVELQSLDDKFTKVTRTPSLETIPEETVGSVAAGARSVSFHNATLVAATVAGGSLPPGMSVTYSAGAEEDDLDAIAYETTTGGELLISKVV